MGVLTTENNFKRSMHHVPFDSQKVLNDLSLHITRPESTRPIVECWSGFGDKTRAKTFRITNDELQQYFRFNMEPVTLDLHGEFGQH